MLEAIGSTLIVPPAAELAARGQPPHGRAAFTVTPSGDADPAAPAAPAAAEEAQEEAEEEAQGETRAAAAAAAAAAAWASSLAALERVEARAEAMQNHLLKNLPITISNLKEMRKPHMDTRNRAKTCRELIIGDVWPCRLGLPRGEILMRHCHVIAGSDCRGS